MNAKDVFEKLGREEGRELILIHWLNEYVMLLLKKDFIPYEELKDILQCMALFYFFVFRVKKSYHVMDVILTIFCHLAPIFLKTFYLLFEWITLLFYSDIVLFIRY